MDLRYDEEKVKSTWNFVNKLWNASRFVLMNIEDLKEEDYTLENLSISDKWILNKLNNLIKLTRKHMDKYEFNVVGTELYSFIWDDFCDWYIELSKINMNNTTKSVLLHVLTNILKLLHPFMPYVTEEIYGMLPIKDSDSIMVSSYPKFDKKLVFEDVKLDEIINLIVRIRRIKLENKLGKDFILVHNNNSLVVENIELIKRMTKCENVSSKCQDDKLSRIDINFMDETLSIYYDGTMSEEEIANLIKEKERLMASINRRKNLLANENYVSKAPANIVENDRNNLQKEENELKLIEEKLNK